MIILSIGSHCIIYTFLFKRSQAQSCNVLVIQIFIILNIFFSQEDFMVGEEVTAPAVDLEKAQV